ncbi:MAG: gamma-glutamyltransferase family protein [Pseudomonadota bacterium]
MRDFQAPGRSLVLAQGGMAATSHPLASQVAIQTLQAGGNAVDGALAAAAVLPLCEPHMCGLGGDCFALIQPGDGGAMIGLNASGRAPAGLNGADLRAQGFAQMQPTEAHSVTVPGAVAGFVTLSQDHGRLSLADAWAPAIRYAEAGVPVAPRVASDWTGKVDRLQGIARDHYLMQGAAYPLGALFKAPGQAALLSQIAKDGREAFYTGPVAQDMVDALQAAGGTHTAEDFAAQTADYVTPIAGTYRGHTLTELPPNGQGAIALLMLNILERFDMGALDPMSPEKLHIEMEAIKVAYDARTRFIADADHMTRLDHLLSPQTADQLAALIDPKRALPGPPSPTEHVHKETVYLTVVDGDGMMVSLIYSIYDSFGSGLAAPGTGILFHNRGSGFTLDEGHPNEAGPGKRPMHTIIPAMLDLPTGGRMSFGVMGGSYQAAGHARFVSNMVDYGMDPQEAMDHPRMFFEDGQTRLENRYPVESLAALRALGHQNVVHVTDPIGGSQAILRGQTGLLTGASDPRKDGCALGY